jgi:hypothetical protein
MNTERFAHEPMQLRTLAGDIWMKNRYERYGRRERHDASTDLTVKN